MAPTRLPLRPSSLARMSASSASTSCFTRPGPPTTIDADRSRTSHVVNSRSSLNSRTCGSSSRAVTFQSMCRASSPSTYGRRPAKSKPVPRRGVRYPPWTRPSSRRTTRHSSRSSSWSVPFIFCGGSGGSSPLLAGRAASSLFIGTARRPGGQGGHPPCGTARSWLQHHIRHRHGAQHPDQDGVGVEVVGQRLVRQHNAVAQHVECHFIDVAREHVVPAAQERECPAAKDERDRGPRARPVAHVPV